jgi:uncharacterized FlaG/YvyC family protein
MEFNPINSVHLGAPVTSGLASTDASVTDRQLVAAVQSLNQSELLGQDRELAYRRDPRSGRLVAQIVRKDTGEVIDQIPPEALLELGESLAQRIRGKASEE